jgi:hypothetical protein
VRIGQQGARIVPCFAVSARCERALEEEDADDGTGKQPPTPGKFQKFFIELIIGFKQAVPNSSSEIMCQ